MNQRRGIIQTQPAAITAPGYSQAFDVDVFDYANVMLDFTGMPLAPVSVEIYAAYTAGGTQYLTPDSTGASAIVLAAASTHIKVDIGAAVEIYINVIGAVTPIAGLNVAVVGFSQGID